MKKACVRMTLDDYIGQEKAKEILKDIYRSCKTEGEALDHVLVLWTSGTWKDDSCRNYCQ